MVSCKRCIHIRYHGPDKELECDYNKMGGELEAMWYCAVHKVYVDTGVVERFNEGIYSVLVEKEYFKDMVLMELEDGDYTVQELMEFNEVEDTVEDEAYRNWYTKADIIGDAPVAVAHYIDYNYEINMALQGEAIYCDYYLND